MAKALNLSFNGLGNPGQCKSSLPSQQSYVCILFGTLKGVVFCIYVVAVALVNCVLMCKTCNAMIISPTDNIQLLYSSAMLSILVPFAPLVSSTCKHANVAFNAKEAPRLSMSSFSRALA